MKSSANPSALWSRRSATMKSCGLSNGCAEANGSFVTTRLGAEKTEPCSTFPWQFHQSKTRAGRLLVRQELHVTLPSVSETIADAPPSTWSPACWLVPDAGGSRHPNSGSSRHERRLGLRRDLGLRRRSRRIALSKLVARGVGASQEVRGFVPVDYTCAGQRPARACLGFKKTNLGLRRRARFKFPAGSLCGRSGPPRWICLSALFPRRDRRRN